MSESRTIYNVAGLDENELDEVLLAVPHHQQLSEVLAWASSLDPPRKPELSLALDEFAHDVVLALNEDIFLVYDVT